MTITAIITPEEEDVLRMYRKLDSDDRKGILSLLKGFSSDRDWDAELEADLKQRQLETYFKFSYDNQMAGE